jgi:hypothetical protein
MSTGRSSARCFVGVLVLFVGSALARAAGPAKLKSEEVLARYLDSIGAAEARSAVKSRVARGTCRMAIVQGGNGVVQGPAVFESEGRKIALKATFNYPEYPGELLGFDGEKVRTPYVSPGRRSRLGDLVFEFEIVLREGLFGAALSTASPLFDLSGRKALLDYEGVKKINGRDLHQLLYRARRDAPNMTIRLYFEPDTFRHVMTIYDVSAGGTLGGNPDDPAQRGSARIQAAAANRLRIEETFSDFKPSSGLMLPTSWKVRFSTEPATGPARIFEWTTVFNQIADNEPFDPALFNP